MAQQVMPVAANGNNNLDTGLTLAKNATGLSSDTGLGGGPGAAIAAVGNGASPVATGARAASPNAPIGVGSTELVKLPADAPLWSCKIETQPRDDKGFTVGEVFEWSCNGAGLSLKEPIKVQLPEKGQYALVLLNPVKISENEIRYQATSYRPGNITFDRVDVIDSEGHGFYTDKINFKVQSVIDPKNPPKEPFGPMGPYKMAWPLWIFFAVVVVIAVLLVWTMVFFRRRLQKKILERTIKKFQTPMGSYHQFSKDLRAIKRQNVFSEHQNWSAEQTSEFLQKLNESFRLFILREFTVPATTWGVKPIVREIKRQDPSGFDKYKSVLLKAFRELDRAKASVAGLKNTDCEQIAQITWQAVDLIWKTKRESAKGGIA